MNKEQQLKYIVNITNFNKELMELNTLYSEEIERLKARINKAIKICKPLVEWGECTINGKIIKEIYSTLKGSDENE